MTERRHSRWILQYDGRDAPDAVRLAVSSVVYSETVVGRPAPVAELALEIGNRQYRATDARVLQPGTKVDLYVTVSGKEADAVHVVQMPIVKVVPRFVATGIPSMSVLCRDPSDGAREGDETRSWPRQSDAQRARSIAQRHGWATTWKGQSLIGKGGGSTDGDQVAPDIGFLAEIAKRYGYDTGLRWDPDSKRWALIWGEPVRDESNVRDWRHNAPGWPVADQIQTWNPIVASAGRQVTGVEVLGYDHRTQEVRSTQNRQQVRFGLDRDAYGPLPFEPLVVEKVETQILGTTIRASVFGEAVRIHSANAVQSQQEAQELARAWMREHGDLFVAGRGSIAGDPTIRAGQVHDFGFFSTEESGQTLIKRFTGRHLLTSVVHRMDPGAPYLVEFGARMIGDR